MTASDGRGRASEPEQLGALFVEYANRGDLEGLVQLYETEAVLAFPPGSVSTGTEAIRRAYAGFIESRPSLKPGAALPTLRCGELALTSTRLADGTVTVEVARRQPDGSWRWIIDQPRLVEPTEPDA